MISTKKKFILGIFSTILLGAIGSLQGLNYTPSDEDYFSEAWRRAVEDNLVDSNSRNQYTFVLSK